MYSKYFILIVFYILIQSYSSSASNSLTNHDFCLKQSKNTCSGNFSYDCKPDKCSIDKISCVYLNSLAFTLRAYKLRPTYEQELKKFKDFNSLIRDCSLKKYELKTEDYCQNKFKCMFVDFNVISNMNEYKVKDWQCVSEGKHSYKCTKQICSKDKLSCDIFNKISITNKTASVAILKKIKNCIKNRN